MKSFIFFFPTRYHNGGISLVTMLELSLALKADKHAKRLRECCEEHVRAWQEEISR